MTESKMIEACPECDSSQKYKRKDKTPQYKCGDCGHEYNTPINRKEKQRGPSNRENTFKIACYHCQTLNWTSQTTSKKCTNCGASIMVWRGRVEFEATNPVIKKLANGPCIQSEFENRPSHVARGASFRLDGFTGSKSTESSRPQRNEVVWYLPGDERAAVSRYIQENTEYVESCLGDTPNPLRSQWSDGLYELLVEQYHYLDA